MWSRIEIAGKPVDAFEPADSSRFALLWLPEQNGASPTALTSLLRKHRLPCVAPRGHLSWWVDRVCADFDPVQTPEQYLLRNVVPHFRLPARSIGVAGIEMGGQAAVRLGLKYPKVFPVVASLGGAIDFHELHGRGTPLDDLYDTRERCRQDTATLHMHPTDWPPHLWFACDPADPWFRGNDRLDEKLRAYGVPHTADLETTGLGYFVRMWEPMLQFVMSGLERESRRLM